MRRLWVGIALLFAACGASKTQTRSAGGVAESYAEPAYDTASVDSDDGYDAPAAASAAPMAPQRPQQQQQQPQQPQQQQPQQPATQVTRQPLLIYTANLTLAVFEAKQALDAVEQVAEQRGGYLVSRAGNQVTVRVPAGAFAEALEQIAALGDELHRQVSAQDVTAEFRDLQVRLDNLLAVRKRLEQLLAQAKNVQEALTVERELERVTMQIEQIKGRLKLLNELLAFSTITVAFQARPVEQVEGTVRLPFPWLDDLGLPRLMNLQQR